MTIQIQPGIHLTVIPTEKYKTIRMFLRFTTKHSEKKAASRTLLTSLLETNSLNFPNQTDVSSKLAELYGASFGVNVGKKGNTHQINVSLSLVNGKYIGNDQVFSEGVDFLKEILFSPNIKEGAFDKETFEIEKENLISYINSLSEDKQTLAALKLQELYFSGNVDQKTPSYGDVDQLQKITAVSLVQEYQEMIANDRVDIFVVGDIDEQTVCESIDAWDFPKNERVKLEMFYHQELAEEVKKTVLVEPVSQAKLNLGYQTSVYYGDTRRFALMIFNGLFGGFPHSKLFINVREKASLAYYASSSVDTFRGFLSVQTGIDGKNRTRVQLMIAEQLESLRQGEFTQEEIDQTKVMLKNHYLLSLDNPQALVESAYLKEWLPEADLSEEEFLNGLMAVTKEEIQAVARDLELQVVFVLDGEE